MSNYSLPILADRPPSRPARVGHVASPCRCWNAWSRSGRRRAATATPRRSAFIYLANGVHSLNYQITTPGKDYQFSRSLKPLEKHREVITPISGLHHPGSLSHHHNCIIVWLTGGKLGPSDRNTISVDQKMAEITAQHTRYPSLEVAITQDSLAWTADGVRLPAMRRCSEIFASHVRGAERRHRGPAAGLAPQRQRPRCQPRRSAPARAENGLRGQGTHGSIPHLRPRGGDPHAAGRYVARYAAARHLRRRSPTHQPRHRRHQGGRLFPHGL